MTTCAAAAAGLGKFGATFLCAIVLAAKPGLAQNGSLETAIKATFLYKFVPFIQWPPSALPQGRPFEICTIGNEPFGEVLDRAVRGQRVAERRIEVRRLAALGPEDLCHIAFIAGSAAQPVGEVLEAAAGRPILTVTDEALSPDQPRGIVHFVVLDNRVRFRIDDRAASVGALDISSKLLSLATAVVPRPRKDRP